MADEEMTNDDAGSGDAEEKNEKKKSAFSALDGGSGTKKSKKKEKPAGGKPAKGAARRAVGPSGTKDMPLAGYGKCSVAEMLSEEDPASGTEPHRVGIALLSANKSGGVMNAYFRDNHNKITDVELTDESTFVVTDVTGRRFRVEWTTGRAPEAVGQIKAMVDPKVAEYP